MAAIRLRKGEIEDLLLGPNRPLRQVEAHQRLVAVRKEYRKHLRKKGLRAAIINRLREEVEPVRDELVRLKKKIGGR